MRLSSFGFEDLEVWQKSVNFCIQVIDLTENIISDRKHFRLVEQLEASSTSIASNIAEGKGRYSKREYVQFLYIARGSLCETITLLEVFFKKGWINQTKAEKIRILGEEIGKMLSGLIFSIKKTIN